MAKKKSTARSKKAASHLSSPDSFRFALNVAVLATLMAVLVYMLGQVQIANNDLRTKAAPMQQGR